MLTSRKKTKLKFLGVILGLSCFIIGCSKQISVNENKTIENEVINVDSALLNNKVTPKTDSKIYKLENNSIIEVGTVKTNSNLDLSDETYKNFIKLKNSNLYVDSNDILKSDRWYEKRNNLIPFNKNIKTKNVHSLYDEKNNLVITLNYSTDYPVYILENDNQMYGIDFQNEILYIRKDEIETMYDSNNSNQDVGNTISVLMYHFFYSEANNETRKDVNFVEVNEFDEQLDKLQENNFKTLSMRETYEFMKGRAQIPSKSVVITIDDGDPSVYKYAYPVIKEHKMNATLFLITGQEDPTLSYDYIMMREDGLELQSHSWQMHQGGCSGMGHGGRLLCVDYETGVLDTKMSFDYVDGGYVYCYPFGDVNENAKKIISDGGAKMAFTTKYGKIEKGMDLLELPRIRVSGGNSIESFMSSID